MSDHENAGYDDWLDAIAGGEAYFLECANGHGSLPPRRVCPDCGATDLEATPLPETGSVETYTVVHVPAPSFADDAPYTTVVVDFGPVRITGVADDDVEVGTEVSLTIGETETENERLLRFERR